MVGLGVIPVLRRGGAGSRPRPHHSGLQACKRCPVPTAPPAIPSPAPYSTTCPAVTRAPRAQASAAMRPLLSGCTSSRRKAPLLVCTEYTTCDSYTFNRSRQPRRLASVPSTTSARQTFRRLPCHVVYAPGLGVTPRTRLCRSRAGWLPIQQPDVRGQRGGERHAGRILRRMRGQSPRARASRVSISRSAPISARRDSRVPQVFDDRHPAASRLAGGCRPCPARRPSSWSSRRSRRRPP